MLYLSSAQLGRIIPGMKAIACALLGLLTASTAFPQQVGIVDLTQPIGVLGVAEQSGNQLAPGCTQEKRGIMAHGVRRLDDDQPRTMLLQIIKLSSDTLEVGGDGRAEVRLTNTSEKPISIPWSTDSSVIQKTPNPDHLEWEQGNFQVVLSDKQNHAIGLKSTDWSLYGSKFVRGSLLTIKPGEWVTAFLNFKGENRFHNGSFFAEFPVGEAKLFLEWEQEFRIWERKNCNWNTWSFDYKDYYKQERPTATVQVMRSGSGKNKNSK
jgi:hypothetical protein